jgi:hypothetical protein
MLLLKREVNYVVTFFFSIYVILPAALWALGSTQPLTERVLGNFLGGKGRPARRAVNLTAIYEPIV